MRNNRSTFLFVVVAVLMILSWMAADAVLQVDAANGDSTIRFHRTLQISAGKQAEATRSSKEVEQYLNSNYPEGTFTVYTELFESSGRVHWFSDFKDLATLEGAFNKLATDQGYQALVTQSRGNFVPDKLHDTVYRTMR